MFQSRYRDTIYALYKDSPKHRWFFELTTSLEDLFSGVNLDNVLDRQRACESVLSQYETADLYQRLSVLYTDLMALSLSDNMLEFPCGPGGINLYFNKEFVLTLVISDYMPAEDRRFSSLVYNSSTFCLKGEMPVRRWQYKESLSNAHWDRQFPNLVVEDAGSQMVKPGEFLATDCRTGFNKVNKKSSFVAISVDTKPLLDVQVELDSNTLKPLRMIDANSDKSQSKLILKILPALAKDDCDVEDIIHMALDSKDHTVRWEAIKASVLSQASFAELAVLSGLQDVNDDVRHSCQRLVSECAE